MPAPIETANRGWFGGCMPALHSALPTCITTVLALLRAALHQTSHFVQVGGHHDAIKALGPIVMKKIHVCVCVCVCACVCVCVCCASGRAYFYLKEPKNAHQNPRAELEVKALIRLNSRDCVLRSFVPE